jgi:hypothetical protein
MVFLDKLDRIVYAGALTKDKSQNDARPETADLVIFDRDLKEVDRQVIKPGLASTGRLFATPDPNVVLGVIAKDRAIYRYDVVQKKLLGWRDLDGAVVDSAARGDGSVWLVIDRALVRVDLTTLDLTSFGPKDLLPQKANNLEWLGGDLYFNVKDELYRIVSVGIRPAAK